MTIFAVCVPNSVLPRPSPPPRINSPASSSLCSVTAALSTLNSWESLTKNISAAVKTPCANTPLLSALNLFLSRILPIQFLRSAGSLREILAAACEESGRSMRELTVLKLDPYRYDTPKNHALGAWFAQQVERFVPEDEQIHIRGLHYLISSSNDARKIGNALYVNNDDNWDFLNDASYPARWLGYVPFARISDARNEEADLYLPEDEEAEPLLIGRVPIELPIGENLMPSLTRAFSHVSVIASS